MYIFIAVVITVWAWLAYEIKRAPLYKEEEEIDDPTTTCWHDDDHHPNESF